MKDDGSKASDTAREVALPGVYAWSRDEVKATITKVARASVGADVEHMDEAALLDDSVGMDSLNRMTLVCDLEEKLGVELWNGDLRELRSLGQFVDHVYRIVAGGAPGDAKRAGNA